VIQQISLFSSAPQPARRGPVDIDSEMLLSHFATARLRSGTHRRSVARDVSQLRALLLTSVALGGPCTMNELFAELSSVAQALCTPSTPTSRSTGHARLLAAQQFIRYRCIAHKQDVSATLAALDQLLPRRPASRWHTTGTLVAGDEKRARRRTLTLSRDDLARLVEATGYTKRPQQAARDRALVALHCYTGLRAEEIVCLKWEHLMRAVVSPGEMGVAVHVQRTGIDIILPLAKPAAILVIAFASSLGGAIGAFSGPLFRAQGPSGRPLSYRAARDILQAACQSAGLPVVTVNDLRAAWAHWLHTQDWSDHAIAESLGLVRVRSVDRLLVRHKAIDAQRQVREAMDR
jgi:integrase